MFGILTVAIFLPAAMGLPVYVLGRRNIRLARLLGVGTTAAELVVTLIILGVFSYGIGGFQLAEKVDWAISFGLTYHVALDGISLPLLLIATILSFLAAYGSTDLIKEREPEYYALFLLFETGIIGVFTSLDLILFYVFWEIVLVPMFFFVGIWGGPRKKYASMKFLIFTYTGSVIMLFGFLAVYAWTSSQGNPTFDYTELVGRVGGLALPLQLAASIATFVGFAVKLPIVPFHTWLPDAHVEAPAPVSVLLAGLLLKMGGYGLIRFNLLFFPAATNVLWPYFAAIGLVTMIYGASVAIVQRDLKRMIAMTSINHMGYVLLGAFTLNGIGLSGAVFQMFNHALAIGILFLMSGYIHEHAGTRNIDELTGLRGKMPLTVTLLVLGSMAAMAVPGLSNFISEYFVIQGALRASYFFAIAIVAPALTVGYFLWMLRRVVMTPGVGARNEISLHSLAILAAFLIPLFVLGAYPGPLLDSIIRATTNPLAPGGP
ncbi:NADH-quinone oxidoreductase subunit M [Candidatus Bathyarchaeota archaeon]|nr:MAG: NADH-quinone oxidoreductase subunit M [Candidatus Bathyarchaeota archaeon]